MLWFMPTSPCGASLTAYLPAIAGSARPRNLRTGLGRTSMNIRVSRAGRLAAALLALPLLSFGAAAQLAVSSNDHKAVLVNGVNTVPPNPADDTVTLIDLGVSPPKVVGELKAPSSVVGPPQNVAIAPDESFALVSANMKLDPADPKKLGPDKKHTLISKHSMD